VLGLQLSKARQRIRVRRCRVGTIRRARSLRSLRGRVIGQNPRARSLRRRGYPVNLIVGRGGR
jgi:beta-lactam-binding protein with PASTA domain